MPSYLESPSSKILRVEENGGAWVWANNDSTAGFGVQIAEILEETAELLLGLPPLTSALCVATALRHWESEEVWMDRLRKISIESMFEDPSGTENSTYQSADFDAGLYGIARWLNQLSSYSADLRTGPRATAAVLACGLEGSSDLLDVTDADEIKEIIRYLRLPDEDRPDFYEALNSHDTQPIDYVRVYCKRTLETLKSLASQVESETQLENWRKTGLKDPLRPAADKGVVEPTTFSDALTALEQRSEYSAIGRFSRNLASMISLPRLPVEPDHLPIGGVSDVTNRGNPERLLMTELAADPMLLLARISNGQALYMRREMPPRPTAKIRQVLVETTIQCWGITRIRLAAFALAVAISEQSRTKAETEFIMLSGDGLKAIDSASETGLVALIEELSASSQPGEALKQFLEDRDSFRDTGHARVQEQAEPLILLTASTFRNAEFQTALHSIKRGVLLGIVERSGEGRIIRSSPSGHHLMQTFKVDLDPRKIEVKANQAILDQPLFVHQRFPPLAFSGSSRDVEWMVYNEVPESPIVWQVTSDRRLLYYCNSGNGGEEISDLLPASRVLAADPRANEVDFVVANALGQHFLVHADVESHELSVGNLGMASEISTYAFSGSFLLQFIGERCQVFGRQDRKLLTSYKTNRSHVGGCYQASPDCTLWVHGGAAPHDWHELGKVEIPENGEIGSVLESDKNDIVVLSADLRWAVKPRWLQDQTTPSQTTSKITELPRELWSSESVRAIPVARSANTRSWVLRLSNSADQNSERVSDPGQQRYLLDLDGGRAAKVGQPLSAETTRLTTPRAYQIVRRKPVRRRARSVGLDRHGIVFERGANSFFQLRVAHDRPRRLIITKTAIVENQQMFGFGEPYRLGTNGVERGWTLRRADLPGGTCWLDSRGLFHFKRADSPAELTLVFSDSHVAGWFSQSGLFGPKYFFPYSTQLTREVVVGEPVIQWIREWCLTI